MRSEELMPQFLMPSEPAGKILTNRVSTNFASENILVCADSESHGTASYPWALNSQTLRLSSSLVHCRVTRVPDRFVYGTDKKHGACCCYRDKL